MIVTTPSGHAHVARMVQLARTVLLGSEHTFSSTCRSTFALLFPGKLVFKASGRMFSCSIIAGGLSLRSAVRKGIACSTGLFGSSVGAAPSTTGGGGTYTPTATWGQHA